MRSEFVGRSLWGWKSRAWCETTNQQSAQSMQRYLGTAVENLYQVSSYLVKARSNHLAKANFLDKSVIKSASKLGLVTW